MENTSEANLNKVMQTILTGGRDTVTLSNTDTVVIKVCNGEALPKLLNFAAKVATDLGLSLKDPDGIKDKLLEKADDVGFLLQLISNYTEEVYALLGTMSSLESADNVRALPIDDILKVLLQVVAVNHDFFTKRVLPTFRGGK